MKKFLLSLFSVGTLLSTYAQEIDIKPSSIGFNFTLVDFTTAEQIKQTSLGDVIKSGDFAKISGRMNPAFGVQFWKGLTTHLDVSGTYTGSFLQRPPVSSGVTGSDAPYFQTLNAMLHAKMFQEKTVINPFLSAGIGGFNFQSNWGAYIPFGLGIQTNLGGHAQILLQTMYHAKLTDNTANYISHSLGVIAPIAKKKELPPPPPPPPAPVVLAPVDTDGDGIPDTEDACPAEAGTVALKGCPDNDKDGIANKEDKCPDVAGLAKYGGCPIPDTDGDGVNDEQDKCITVPGLARYAGCPIPDTDGDGVNDEEDKCPNVAGPAENGGCPKLEQFNFNSKKVQFATGSAVLVAKAKTELDKLIPLLNEHPELKVAIEGHTDNTGKATANQTLSQKRAESVKAYLVKKGISADRLSATGFGQDSPIADNKTAAGKLANRRVEFKAMQ